MNAGVRHPLACIALIGSTPATIFPLFGSFSARLASYLPSAWLQASILRTMRWPIYRILRHPSLMDPQRALVGVAAPGLDWLSCSFAVKTWPAMLPIAHLCSLPASHSSRRERICKTAWCANEPLQDDTARPGSSSLHSSSIGSRERMLASASSAASRRI